MRVSVFGLGYVGSVSAACLARAGHEVIGVDVNPDKVAMIPHISSLMCNDLDEVLAHADVLVIGNTDDDSSRATAAARDHHILIDLTRRAVPPRTLEAEPVCA
jgi:UDP-glucose 6-dehydrogenase